MAGNPPPNLEQVLQQLVQSQAQQAQQMLHLQNALGQLVTALNAQPAPAPAPAPIGSSSLRVKEPRVFDGRAVEVQPFLSELRDSLHLQRRAFATDYDKAIFMHLYLKNPGSPGSWWTGIEKHKSYLLHNLDALILEFKQHFEDSDLKATMQRKLDELTQRGSAADYASRFQEILAHLQLSEETKVLAYRRGLKDSVLTAIAVAHDDPTTLDGAVKLSIKIDNRLHQLAIEQRHRSRNGSAQPAGPPPPPQPFVAEPVVAHAPAPVVAAPADVVPMEIDALRRLRAPAAAPASGNAPDAH